MSDRLEVADTAYKTWVTALRAKQVWFGRDYSKDEKTWLAVADYVIRGKLDVIRFITAQIEAIDDPEVLRNTAPSDIFDKKHPGRAQARYQKMLPTTTVSLHRQCYVTMRGHLASAQRRLIPRVYTGVDQLLINPGFPFSAWFRVLLAPAGSDGYPHIMNCYLEQAKEEIITDPCLRQFLEEMKSEHDLTRFGWHA